MLLTENGELFECGEAEDEGNSVPRQNVSLEPRCLLSKVSNASMTCTHAAVVSSDGKLVDLENPTVAIEKPFCPPKKVTEVACGNDFTVILVDEAVYTWGSGEHGQLGHGDRKDISSPKVRSLILKLLIDI